MTPSTRRATGVAAVAGPLLLLASTLAYLAGGDGLSEGELGGAVQVWAFAVSSLAVVGLARLLDDVAPRAAVAVTALALLGAAGSAAYGLDAVQAAVTGVGVQDSDSAAVPLALRVPGLAWPVAVAALGILLARHDRVPRAAGYGLAVAAVLFPPARIADVAALALASDLLALVTLTAIALPLLRPTAGAGAGVPTAGPSAARSAAVTP